MQYSITTYVLDIGSLSNLILCHQPYFNVGSSPSDCDLTNFRCTPDHFEPSSRDNGLDLLTFRRDRARG
ncbi:hypothetical protein Cob_v004344 [Colletotrichum orbiculare MAFF 240422]|uniref:Uncharacterized protein n=1 Tax=Colletotrichum orbiculare (strain 104-T / ATCC 96160 / CBS 514.97 / LARS 414 / MAFF 240422) TaxID=1213857 RepID=A0A484FYM6_COLOR|nr:hypothetical protein Cob_v004344 [Colletotrichum orbiculare MAFF 240422]